MLEASQVLRRRLALDRPEIKGTGISIQPLAAEGRLKLRLDAGSLARAPVAAGFALDRPINTITTSNGRASVRLGPNEWILIAPDAEVEAAMAEVEAALRGEFFALVDISHRHVAIEVKGRHAPEVLSAGCPLDLHLSRFPTGSASRTLLGKVEIIVARTDDWPIYRVECWRSFASYTYGFLAEAAQEFC